MTSFDICFYICIFGNSPSSVSMGLYLTIFIMFIQTYTGMRETNMIATESRIEKLGYRFLNENVRFLIRYVVAEIC